MTPVTRGARLASFFWVQRMLSNNVQRALLFELDRSIQRLNATDGDPAARAELAGCHHYSMRMCSGVA